MRSFCESELRIRRLRHAGEDLLNARLNLARVLGAIEAPVTPLPTHSLLCVRRVTLPWRSQRGDLSRALTKALDLSARNAIRPWIAAVPTNAEAVWFASEAEFLACLARDALDPEATGYWWWRSLFPCSTLAESARTVWTESPQEIPPALELLDSTGQATAFLTQIDPHDAEAWLRNVSRAFALHDMANALEHILSSRKIAIVDAAARPAKRIQSEASRHTPWQPWLIADVHSPRSVQLLQVIVTLLRRAPDVVRSQAFAREVADWFAPAAIDSPTHRATGFDSDSPAASSSSSAQSPVVRDSLGELVGSPRSTQTVAPQQLDFQTASATIEATRREWPIDREVVTTEWGGVFYLVNLALFLELYGDFTMPMRRNLQLPVWDFLVLLGLTLTNSDSQTDPLWPALAKLSGRAPGEPAGKSFIPPDRWRLPDLWHAVFPDQGPCQRLENGGRIQTIHPAGFVIEDIPLVRDAPDCEPVDSLVRWVNWVTDYTDARLKRAVNVRNDDELCELVFHHRAQIEISASRIDVHFNLQRHPVALRLAGLDRNPGWVPAAGRTIHFHYD